MTMVKRAAEWFGYKKVDFGFLLYFQVVELFGADFFGRNDESEPEENRLLDFSSTIDPFSAYTTEAMDNSVFSNAKDILENKLGLI
jgi:hypothetical protein